MILSLNCLFLGEAPIRSIPVIIGISCCLDNLNLWKVNLVIVNENDKVLEISSTEDDIKEKLGGELMNPQSSLGKYFNENSFKDEENSPVLVVAE
ncbi:hypothetical protein C1646_752562 [Rhizophagus diaphanus]|nr:hypothetical protein C1646_752562 [Rhizophagus diaphanus] [Rhizophagus sp. MUCL 43196]